MRKHIYCVLCIILVIVVSTFTVNAATDNGIVDLINRVIRVNGREATAKVYETSSGSVYSNCLGEYVTITESKCIKYSPIKDYDGNVSEICYAQDAEFSYIEIFYDENNHFAGFHIKGVSEGKYFVDYLKDSN